MLTLSEQAVCSNNRTGGCPGKRSDGRAPTREEIETIGRRVVQAWASDNTKFPHGKGDSGGRGKGRGSGGGGRTPWAGARPGGEWAGRGPAGGRGGAQAPRVLLTDDWAGRGGGGPGGHGGGQAPRAPPAGRPLLLTDGLTMTDIAGAYYHGYAGYPDPRHASQGQFYPGFDPHYGGRVAGYGGGN